MKPLNYGPCCLAGCLHCMLPSFVFKAASLTTAGNNIGKMALQLDAAV